MQRHSENDLRSLVALFLLMCLSLSSPALLPSKPRVYYLPHLWTSVIRYPEPTEDLALVKSPPAKGYSSEVELSSVNGDGIPDIDIDGIAGFDGENIDSFVRNSPNTRWDRWLWPPFVAHRTIALYYGTRSVYSSESSHSTASYYQLPDDSVITEPFGPRSFAFRVYPFFWSAYVPYNPVLGPPASTTSTKRVDAIVDGMELANVAFHVPQTMVLNKPQDAELVLSLAMTARELREQLQDKLGWTSSQIHVSNRMEARIYGTSNFKVLPTSPETQLVSSTDVVRWNWEITPSEVGDRTLSLEVFAHISIDGEDAPHRVQTIRQKIKVNVTTTQRVATFAQTNLQWLMTAFAIPLFLFTWKGWRERKKKRESLNPLGSTPLASRWVQ